MRTLGIILAGGRSTRLFPATLATTKQLLPVFDKPLVYYPLSTLMLMGIREFVIITTPEEHDRFKTLFKGYEKELGITIKFATQDKPNGIPEAFNIARNCVNIGSYDNTVLILGDNIFYGSYMSKMLSDVREKGKPAVVLKQVRAADAHRFGIADIQQETLVNIIEKPTMEMAGNWAVTGLYFYPRDVYDRTHLLTPSRRGELEITDLNNTYIGDGWMEYVKLLRGMVWFDTGTPESLLDASNLMRGLQEQGMMVGSPHEIAYNNGWVKYDDLEKLCYRLRNSAYGQYLREEVL